MFVICFDDIFYITITIYEIKPVLRNSTMCGIKDITNIVAENSSNGFNIILLTTITVINSMLKPLLNASEADLVPVFGKPAEIIFICFFSIECIGLSLWLLKQSSKDQTVTIQAFHARGDVRANSDWLNETPSVETNENLLPNRDICNLEVELCRNQVPSKNLKKFYEKYCKNSLKLTQVVTHFRKMPLCQFWN